MSYEDPPIYLNKTAEEIAEIEAARKRRDQEFSQFFLGEPKREIPKFLKFNNNHD